MVPMSMARYGNNIIRCIIVNRFSNCVILNILCSTNENLKVALIKIRCYSVIEFQSIPRKWAGNLNCPYIFVMINESKLVKLCCRYSW